MHGFCNDIHIYIGRAVNGGDKQGKLLLPSLLDTDRGAKQATAWNQSAVPNGNRA